MKFIHQLRLRQKLAVLITLLGLTVAVLVGTEWATGRARDAIVEATQNRYTSYLLADELRQSSDELTKFVRNYVATGDARWEQVYNEVLDIRGGKKARPAGYEGIYWDFRVADIAVPGSPGETIALLDMMKRAGFNEAEMSKLAEAASNSAALIDTEVLAMNLVKGLHPDGKGGWTKGDPNMDKARELVNDAAYHRNKAKIMAPVNDFFRMLDARTSGDILAAQHDATRMQFIQWGCSAVMLALFFVMLYSIFNQVIVAVQRATRVAETVARGDLSQDIQASGRDELAQLLGAMGLMRGGLIEVVSSVRNGSDQVAAASGEIAQANLNLSERTESQAGALEQTAASMDELSSTVQHNADNARQASQLAQSASAVAVQGGQVVAEVVQTMKGISDSSKKIADIIGVIDGIAFQTNILALNAAVEAARAGEQGRGFAVVAGEVRSLAGRAAEAAKEIKQLINDSVERVDTGTRLVDQAGSTMDEVVTGIRRVADIMGEISSASTEQSAGVRQVGEAVTHMDQATQQNAALVEEMTAAADSLKGQAQLLVQSVAVFKLA